MTRGRPRVLVTGLPGVGKTTLVCAVASALGERHPVGFYTTEIREEGVRMGFELVGLAGRRGTLARVGIPSPHRVGKYGVDVEGLDRFLESIPWLGPSARLLVIDEIGKMECCSANFCALVRRILDSDACLLATIARRGSGLIAEVKQRPDVELIELTVRNRDSLAAEIVRRFA